MEIIEERERLRLDLETFLRERHKLGENFIALAEEWDARGPLVSMNFRTLTGALGCLTSPIEEFEAWRSERQGA